MQPQAAGLHIDPSRRINDDNLLKCLQKLALEVLWVCVFFAKLRPKILPAQLGPFVLGNAAEPMCEPSVDVQCKCGVFERGQGTEVQRYRMLGERLIEILA